MKGAGAEGKVEQKNLSRRIKALRCGRSDHSVQLKRGEQGVILRLRILASCSARRSVEMQLQVADKTITVFFACD
jgi:hypothetical protein